MKLLELHLKAFGPFTDLRLDLGAGAEGLHVLYGPNEAGKSSALRALVDLLFEIPKQTTDAFLHPYGSLRIGGTLQPRAGEPLRVVRRKGVKGTLLSADDEQPLPDDVLEPVLRGVDRGFFTTFFGIDQPTLSHGGEQILVQGGAVGQALFSAALPTGDLSATLAELEDEAGELYKRNASKPSINRAVAEFRDAKRVIKDASLTSAEWQERSQALAQARSELGATSGQLDELLAAERRLVRHGRVLPLLATRREVQATLEALVGAPRLPKDFGDRRQRAQGIRRASQETLRKAGAKLERLREEARALRGPRPILDEAATIESLHQRLGSYKKAQAERPGLVGDAEACRREAGAMVRTLRGGITLEGLEPLRAVLARRRSISALANQHQAVENAVAAALAATARLQDELQETTASTEAAPAAATGQGGANLRHVLAWARAEGDLDRAVDAAARELARRQEEAELALRQLPLFAGTIAELERLAVPPRDSIARYDTVFSDLRAQQRELSNALRQANAELLEKDAKLEEVRAGGALPTEAALVEARSRRDQAWALVRASWRTGVYTDELDAGYEASVRAADELADRLRQEADRVHRHDALVAQRGELAAKLDLIEAEAKTVEGGLAAEEQGWARLWAACGVSPWPPREMSDWLARFEQVRVLAAAARDAARQHAELVDRRRKARAALAREIAAAGAEIDLAGEAMGPLLSGAEELVAGAEKAAARREELLARRAKLETELARTREAHLQAAASRARWRADWAAAIGGSGLSPDALPAEVEDQLDAAKSIFATLDKAVEHERRLEAIDRDSEAFRAAVRAFVERLAPSLAEVEPAQAVTRLNAMLTEARRAATELQELTTQIKDREEEIAEAEASLAVASQQLGELLRLASVGSEDELPAAEERAARRLRAEEDLERVEAQLRVEGEGSPIERLAEETAGADEAGIQEQLHELRARIGALKEHRDQLFETKGRREADLARMDGNARAADAADRAQEILAGLRRDVERYMRLRLASTILRSQIERFRADHQHALLRRGGEIFTRLTLGSFAELQTDLGDQGEPVIVGLRPGGAKLGVSAMSSGTRDQLYLALRLASLERFLASSPEPLPFVVDDILVNFDDDRSAATLDVLADLSRATQVILFTHHRRVRELADRLGAGSQVFVHELSRASGTIG